MWEGGEPHALQLPEVDTIGAYNFEDQLTCSFTAHAKIDPKTGEMMFISYKLSDQSIIFLAIALKLQVI